MIGFDNATNGSYTSSSATHTFSHTVGAGSDRILFVGVDINGGDNVVSVTYGGVAMTQAVKVADAGGAYNYLYYLLNPAVGAANVVVTQSSVTNLAGFAVSYNGAAQQAPEAVNSVNGTSFNLSTVTNNAWIVAYFAEHGSGSPVLTGDLVNQRDNDAATYHAMGDTGVVATPASKTCSVTSATNAGGVGASFASADAVIGRISSKIADLKPVVVVGNGMSRNERAT